MFIIRKILKHFSNMTWPAIILMIVIHLSLAYFGLFIAGESELLEQFYYFYVVTASTVGYGDFSPVTHLGKWIAIFWIIPGAIAIFATMLGKIGSTINNKTSILKTGKASFKDMDKHIVIVGYQPNVTNKLIEEISEKHGNVDKVIVTTDESCEYENWVRAETYSDIDAYNRADISDAKRIVIMLNDDNSTLTAIMAISQAAPGKDIIAHINNDDQAYLIDKNFEHVECVVSNKINSIARSIDDPGISDVFEALLSVNNKDTLYCAKIKNGFLSNINIDQMEEKYDCSVIAYRENKHSEIIFVNNNDKTVFKEGNLVYYISNERIK